jgi:histidinol dehydrogenase
MKVITTSSRGARAKLEELFARRNQSYDRALPVAQRIVGAVRKGGDAALRRYAARFDGLSPQSELRISSDELSAAWTEAPAVLKEALQTAERNIRAFARRQLPKEWSFAPVMGLSVGQLTRPIDDVGCYVPGGRYPLPSTLLMTVIPAQVAGVPRIVVASPRPAPETLAAAAMLGVTEFYRIGGAHAIAALAYGTAQITPVDKIVGPGNAYVTAAKKLVAFDCSVDMLAGPTEIVVTSENGNAQWIAADLVAQSEHDPDTLAIFVTTSDTLARSVVAEVKRQVRSNSVARDAIRNSGYALVARSTDEARDITNRIAPEHLTIDTEADLAWVRNAGSIFIGPNSAQPLGDYISGPNHTLPTSGLARVRGGLSVADFLKVITVQQYTPAALKKLGPAAVSLAEAEGLRGHASAIRTRLESTHA